MVIAFCKVVITVRLPITPVANVGRWDPALVQAGQYTNMRRALPLNGLVSAPDE